MKQLTFWGAKIPSITGVLCCLSIFCGHITSIECPSGNSVFSKSFDWNNIIVLSTLTSIANNKVELKL